MEPPSANTSHDDLVRAYAGFFEARGYRIEAELAGFSQPQPIDGVLPDLIATRYEHRVVLLAETPESVTTERAKQEAKVLRGHSQRSRGQFILAVTDGRVLK